MKNNIFSKIPRTRILIIVGLLGFFSFYLFDTKYQQSKTNGIDSLVLKTNITKRKFIKDSIFKFNNRFEYPNNVFMLYSYNEKLYIINKNTFEIDCFSYKGAKINTFGKQGEAPWENSIVSYVEPTENGYYIFDSGKQLIKRFDYSNKLLYYKKTKSYVLNVCRLNNEVFILPFEEKKEDFEFLLFDMNNGNELGKQSIKPFITDIFKEFPKENIPIIFSGYFSKNTFGKVVYTFNHFGAFVLFNDNGTIKRIVKTVDGFGIPKPKNIDRGNVVENTIQPDIIVNYSRCVDKNNIYILSNILRASLNHNRVIDIYRLSDGQYLNSIEIPKQDNGEKCIEITCNENGVISCLHEDMNVTNYIYDNSKVH